MNHNVPSIYTQWPSEESEAAWNDLWHSWSLRSRNFAISDLKPGKYIGITDNQLALINKTHSVHWLRHPEESRLAGMIQADISGFHHLHCLVSRLSSKQALANHTPAFHSTIHVPE
jgi:hypothetical protein